MDHGGEFCRKLETIIRTNFSMALVPLQEAVCIYTRSVLPLNVLHLCFFYTHTHIYIYKIYLLLQLLVRILKVIKRVTAVQNGKRELKNGKLGKKREVW